MLLRRSAACYSRTQIVWGGATARPSLNGVPTVVRSALRLQPGVAARLVVRRYPCAHQVRRWCHRRHADQYKAVGDGTFSLSKARSRRLTPGSVSGSRRNPAVVVIPAAWSNDWFLPATPSTWLALRATSRSMPCAGAAGRLARRLRVRTAVICVHLWFPNPALSARRGAAAGAQAGMPRACSFYGLKATTDAHRCSCSAVPAARSGRAGYLASADHGRARQDGSPVRAAVITAVSLVA